MMNCQSIRKRLSAYQDGELGPKEQDRIKAHLQNCPECSKHYEELQRTWELLGELPEIHPAPAFYLELQKKISGLNDRHFIPRLRQIFQFLPSPLTMAALLVAGLIIGGYLGNIFFKEGLISLQGHQPAYSQGDVTLASIRTFDGIPPGTLAHGYMRLVSYTEGGDR